MMDVSSSSFKALQHWRLKQAARITQQALTLPDVKSPKGESSPLHPNCILHFSLYITLRIKLQVILGANHKTVACLFRPNQKFYSLLTGKNKHDLWPLWRPASLIYDKLFKLHLFLQSRLSRPIYFINGWFIKCQCFPYVPLKTNRGKIWRHFFLSYYSSTGLRFKLGYMRSIK